MRIRLGRFQAYTIPLVGGPHWRLPRWPEFFGNGFQRASGEWCDEPGGFYHVGGYLYRTEWAVSWRIDT